MLHHWPSFALKLQPGHEVFGLILSPKSSTFVTTNQLEIRNRKHLFKFTCITYQENIIIHIYKIKSGLHHAYVCFDTAKNNLRFSRCFQSYDRFKDRFMCCQIASRQIKIKKRVRRLTSILVHRFADMIDKIYTCLCFISHHRELFFLVYIGGSSRTGL